MLTSDRLDKIEDLPKAKSRKSLVSKLHEYASAHASLISFVILIAFLETIIAWREIPDYVSLRHTRFFCALCWLCRSSFGTAGLLR